MHGLDPGRSLAIRTALLAGIGLLAGLSTVSVRAEIVPMTPPVVLVPVPAPDGGAPADPVSEVVPAGGEAAEIVPAKPSSPVPPESAPTGSPEPAPGSAAPEPATGNIRWPSVPATGQVPASDPPQGQLLPDAEADANTGEVAPDPLQRGLDAYRGDGDPRSYAEAARWFRTAAEAGDRRAAMAYAYLQGLGLGVARDPVAARRLLQQLSDAGFARADYLAALLLAADPRSGASGRENEFRERAARAGDAVAQNAMGVHYQLQGDRTTAQMWYRRAADSGSAAARRNLASLERSEREREQEAMPSTAAADADALFEQARRHHRGDGVPVDYGKALQLYRRAAANGSKPAQQMLGLIQSRSLPGGGFDPGWMRQLAFAAVGESGANPVSSVAAAAQPQLDDPLSGLSALEP